MLVTLELLTARCRQIGIDPAFRERLIDKISYGYFASQACVPICMVFVGQTNCATHISEWKLQI